MTILSDWAPKFILMDTELAHFYLRGPLLTHCYGQLSRHRTTRFTVDWPFHYHFSLAENPCFRSQKSVHSHSYNGRSRSVNASRDTWDLPAVAYSTN